MEKAGQLGSRAMPCLREGRAMNIALMIIIGVVILCLFGDRNITHD